MFDGTYPGWYPDGRHANNTDRACPIGKRDKEVVIIPATGFVWEQSGPAIPTAEEIGAADPYYTKTDNIPFASEIGDEYGGTLRRSPRRG